MNFPISKARMLTALILLLLISSANSQSSRASFNQSCSDGVRCDSRASLTCIDGICQCPKPDEMTFHKGKNKCVVLSGERCSYTYSLFDCIDNSTCKDGFCECISSHYFEDSHGSCTSTKLHGAQCSEDKECRLDKHLLCSEGTCSCNETEAVFDPSSKICVGRVGTSCKKYESSCVNNARCTNSYGYEYTSGYSITGTCTCRSDYKASKSGLCLGKHGYSCSELNPCGDGFICNGDKCECRYQNHQYYNSSIQSCVSYVRGPCYEDNNEDGLGQKYPCVENAECTNSTGIHECTCSKGFVESGKRMCEVAYGGSCTASKICDQYASLACLNGKCLCPGVQEFDLETNTCRGLVGAVCESDKDGYCTSGSICERFRDPSPNHTSGVCRCSKPKVANLERKCVDSTEENSDA